LYKHIKLDSQVTDAVWDEDCGKWTLRVESTVSHESSAVEADVFINAGGILNNWKWPEIEGLETFKGALIHTASWVRICALHNSLSAC
jgi:cation diffusion facilitator CzcD-associated flavoprotein CzcO